MKTRQTEAVWKALDNLRIELPSWGFANTGTRFGKFIQLAAASTIEEKFGDAAQVHAVTGACPTLALHVQWDLPNGLQDAGKVKELAEKHGIKPGSINPNVFQDQEYKYGSVGNPDGSIRRKALNHILDCVRIAEALTCRDISPWFADGSNYPGTQSIRKRIGYFEEGLKEVHAALRPGQRLLVEYKPFEPAFYHTDIADWGMALLLAKAAGPQAYVLVDTGHHYQVFRILHEIRAFGAQDGAATDIAYMVDQSHNLKGKIEEMIQTVRTAQELYARAAMVDHERLAGLQQSCSLVDAEEALRGAFWIDTRSVVAEWRISKGLPVDPLLTFRESGYLERITRERGAKNSGA